MYKSNNILDITYIRYNYPRLYKFFSILPWFTSIWLILVIVLWYYFFIISWETDNKDIILIIALLILIYYVWWLIRWFEYISFVLISVFWLLKHDKINYKWILNNEKNLNLYERKLRKDIKKNINKEVFHRFIIPTYKESEEILYETIKSLINSDYDKKKYAVTIAWEEADKENFEKIAKNLIEKYKNEFWFLNYTVHPKWVPWEIPWKWANIKFSAKNSYEDIIKTLWTWPENVVVTTLDADTNIDVNYTNVLTISFLSVDNPKYKSFQPMIFFFNNFRESPFFSKIVSLWNSFFLMLNTVKQYWMRNFSTHAQPLDALIELDFWSSETIVEDWHQYRRSYFWFNWNYECIPIFTKVYQDANLNKSLMLTAKAQYNQMRRWAHWVEDVPYVFCQWMKNFKNLNFIRTFYEFMRLLEWIILWWTLHIVLMIWIALTFIRDIYMSSYVQLGWLVSLFVNMSYMILIISVTLQFLLSPWHKLKSNNQKYYEWWKLLVVYLLVIWPVLLIFTWIPAIHTQISVMLWKPMKKFNVTEKIRK